MPLLADLVLQVRLELSLLQVIEQEVRQIGALLHLLNTPLRLLLVEALGHLALQGLAPDVQVDPALL
eukprot:CAMPEP_0170496726 /NCGR_PEP_ID=MMETSP0208-20121228/22527_1 /TAXON_ID=197538 /ORGANISM="Strombidium inclinatum, Strain S3" /LENGTH=66 /DNA_ID=CAMNT_0010773349 /DNA_START=434 /DNA_END=634 /DNA_ORIENTATION=-